MLTSHPYALNPPLHRVTPRLSLSAFVAGFVAVLVGYASSAAIIFQAAAALGAGPAETASWMLALGIGMGVTCIGLSLAYRTPILTAWSTPGAALLITSGAGVGLPQATAAFMVSGLLIMLVGFGGWFERLMRRIPPALAAAMLAGVLLRFCLDAFRALSIAPGLVLGMLLAYFLGRRFKPRYAVVAALAAGVAWAGGTGTIQTEALTFTLTRPVWVTPAFELSAIIGIAIPLFMVTMASQNAPGVAALRAAGYTPPLSPIIGTTGLTTFVLAPWGGFAFNLAAITAAICMSREAHEDASQRYTASVIAGGFYLLLGVFGASVAGLFAAFPKPLVFAIAGIALLGTIAQALSQATSDDAQREAAIVAFLVTASGVELVGIGAPFWGLVAGLAVSWLLQPKAPQTPVTGA
jgi:benzoate membrane transport protein